jgi:hypothetical protein
MSEIDEVFGVEEKPLKVYERPNSGLVIVDDQQLIDQAKEDKRKNYVIVRENMDELIEQMRHVVLDAAESTRKDPTARMLETFSLLAKTYAEINTQVLEMPNKVTGTSSVSIGIEQPANSVNNAIFVGTNEDILRLIKKQNLSPGIEITRES